MKSLKNIYTRLLESVKQYVDTKPVQIPENSITTSKIVDKAVTTNKIKYTPPTTNANNILTTGIYSSPTWSNVPTLNDTRADNGFLIVIASSNPEYLNQYFIPSSMNYESGGSVKSQAPIFSRWRWGYGTSTYGWTAWKPITVGTQAKNIVTDDLADSGITTAKISDLAVTTAKINALGVTTAKLNDLAVTNTKIADNSVNYNKMNYSTPTNNMNTLFSSYPSGTYFSTGWASYPDYTGVGTIIQTKYSTSYGVQYYFSGYPSSTSNNRVIYHRNIYGESFGSWIRMADVNDIPSINVTSVPITDIMTLASGVTVAEVDVYIQGNFVTITGYLDTANTQSSLVIGTFKSPYLPVGESGRRYLPCTGWRSGMTMALSSLINSNQLHVSSSNDTWNDVYLNHPYLIS